MIAPAVSDWQTGTAFRKARVQPFNAVLHIADRTFTFHPVSASARVGVNVITIQPAFGR